VSHLRSGKGIKLDEEDKRSLEALGFSYEDPSTKRWNSVVFPALCQYWQENGMADIPVKFKIPATDDWPVKWHGLALGQTLSEMRRGKTFQTVSEQDRKDLRCLGYDL
jgi:hypothetical protein